MDEGFHVFKNKKSKIKSGDQAGGVRRSSRLEGLEDIEVTNKAISHAEAKDTFIRKEKNKPIKLVEAGNQQIQKKCKGGV